jgi:hypothetical protein
MQKWKIEITGLEPKYAFAERMQQAVNKALTGLADPQELPVRAPCLVFIERAWRYVKASKCGQ